MIQQLQEIVRLMRGSWGELTSKNPFDIFRYYQRLYRFNHAPIQSKIAMGSLQGWLPTFILFERNAVIWMAREQTRFQYPFVDQDFMTALMQPTSPATCLTDLSAINIVGKESQRVRPTGFVFHISHCGSTLLSNMLRASPKNYMLSEPFAVVGGMRLPAEAQATFYKNVICALGQPMWHTEENYIIKFGDFHTLFLPFIRQAFPETPCIFLYRDPIEVIMGIFHKPTSWVTNKPHPVITKWSQNLAKVEAEALQAMRVEEYVARVIGSYCQMGLEQADSQMLLLQYQELVSGSAALYRVLDFFGIGATEIEKEQMAAAAQIYSKDPFKRRKHTSDSMKKHQQASTELRKQVERWVMEPYQQLEQMRIAQSAINRGA